MEAEKLKLVGNDEVVGLFEYWLDQAKKGDINYATVGVVKLGDQVTYDTAGMFGQERNARIALKALDYELDAIINARKLGPRNYNLDASHVEYHLRGGAPLNWDFLIWLIDAEMTRRRLNGPAPLRIHFDDEDKLNFKDKSFFENVHRPLLPLIGAVEDVNAKGGRHKPVYVPIDIVNHSRAGIEVPKLRSSEKAQETMDGWLHGTKPVVITLREAEHTAHRNSNLEAWLKFAKDLQDKGEDVIFLRDHGKANLPLPGFCSCPIASFNVDLRMALYERAKINLMVSNGPAGLCFFSDTPYLYFVNIQKGDKLYAANNTEWWYSSNGIGRGEQWPWAKPDQKLIWQRDSYENICEAWECSTNTAFLHA